MANAKPRVHEIASELGVDSKVALAKLKELGEFVKSPSSTIEPPVARKLRAALEADGAGSAAASADAKPAASAPAASAPARPAGRPGPARPAAPDPGTGTRSRCRVAAAPRGRRRGSPPGSAAPAAPAPAATAPADAPAAAAPAAGRRSARRCR